MEPAGRDLFACLALAWAWLAGALAAWLAGRGKGLQRSYHSPENGNSLQCRSALCTVQPAAASHECAGPVRAHSLRAPGCALPCRPQAYGAVDEEGGRYLLGDHLGNLLLLVLQREGGR